MLPSTSACCYASIHTGVSPQVHGIGSNEFRKRVAEPTHMMSLDDDGPFHDQPVYEPEAHAQSPEDALDEAARREQLRKALLRRLEVMTDLIVLGLSGVAAGQQGLLAVGRSR